MPNQLAQNKRRKSLTEHEAVLAVLEVLARNEQISAMDFMRQAVREAIRKRACNPAQMQQLRSVIMDFAPKPERHFATRQDLSRFKRRQREFDKILLDLQLSDPEKIEARNSIVSPKCKIRVLELETSDV
jgi:FAD synthase